jgi:hypothetical protein
MDEYEKLKKLLKEIELLSEQFYIKGKKNYGVKLRKKLKEMGEETRSMYQNVQKIKKSMKGYWG